MQFTVATIAAVAGLLSSANAHMLLAKPVPYTGPNSQDNAPLLADGSNFPCKMTSAVKLDDAAAAANPANSAAVGGTVTLATKGTAVHGGGSCQISLTKDNPPTKNSKWMVIHSIEGGCPARNQAGNLPGVENPNSSGNPNADTYQFKIPAGIQPDKYVLAWTWFNRLGNREMYMGCAPFEVKGGSSKRTTIEARKDAERMEKRQSSFPQMYTANICSGCSTESINGKDGAFPDPGASVDKSAPFGGSTAPMQKCSCFGGSGSSGSGPSAPSSPSPAPQAPASSPSPAPQAPAAPASPSPAPQAPAAPVAPAAPAAPAGGCTPGGLVCSADGKQFGICGATGAAVMQAVAAGTACRGGAITHA